MESRGQPELEGYRDCHLCTVQDRTREARCFHCSGQLRLRDLLYLEIEKRWRMPAAPVLSAIVPGLGHWYTGRRYIGTFFLAISPLSIGLVLATYSKWNWGLAVLLLSYIMVWLLAILDAKKGPTVFVPPCQAACPGKVPCSQYVHLASTGRDREALELVESACPFPGTIGRICHHPCEQDCNRGKDGEPIAVCALKRFVDDAVPRNGNIYRRELEYAPVSMGRKVAVVGSGPSGLSAALYLRILGFEVTLFEAQEKAGGTPALYIPHYRLPREVYQREVDRILDLGVDLRLGKALGKDFSLQDLASQGYSAVYLGMGAMRSVRLPQTGEEAQGFIDWRTFLEKVVAGRPPRLEGEALVIGGGNVAMDVARSALRCGAVKVRVVCLEKKPVPRVKAFAYRNVWTEVKPPKTMEFMPAFPWEIDDAVEEGVEILGAGAAVSFDVENGKVCRAHCQEVERIDVDPKGRLMPVLREGSQFSIRADWVITAVGSGPDYGFLGGKPRMRQLVLDTSLHILEGGNIPNIPVLVGGDFASRPASVIEAIAAGREAALYLYHQIVGAPPTNIRFRRRRLLEPWTNYTDTPDKRRRRHEIHSPLGQGRRTFDEVISGFAPSVAREEADRCMRCDWTLIRESKVKRYFRALRQARGLETPEAATKKE